MFYIEDGREHFYQWDTDRRIVVEDQSIKEVHFCNRTGDCSLVCEVYFHDNDFGGVYVANVPNILLQTDWKIRVYAYDGKHTRYDASYEVKSRTKPADYVYTETEVLNYNTLLDRIEAIEEKEVDVDLSNYYTKPEVDEIVENVDVDLTDYVKNTDYADVGKAGVITFATGLGLAKTSNQSLHITRANDTEIKARENRYKPIVPSNLEYAVKSVGDGYYATQAELAEVDGVKQVYVGGETPPEGVGLIWIDSSKTAPDYATKEYVDNAVAASGGSDVDLSDYYTKDETYSKTETDSALNTLDMNLSNWAWAEIEKKADKTELDNYATKEELAAIGGGGSGGGKVYTFDFNILNAANTITDADKAVLEEIKATGSKMDYALYVTDGTWITKITKIGFGNGISLYLNEPYASIEHLSFYFNSDGTYKSCAMNYATDDSNVGWKWQAAYDSYISPYTYTHIKVVGYWDNNSNNITTYELSTSHNNTFEQESNTKYWVSKQYGNTAENIYFENNGGSLSIYDCWGNELALDSSIFTFLGYYYWG